MVMQIVLINSQYDSSTMSPRIKMYVLHSIMREEKRASDIKPSKPVLNSKSEYVLHLI